MLNSLRTRLTLSHLAVIVVAMGLSGALLLSLLERYFLESMERSLLAQAQITVQALIPGARTGEPAVAEPSAAFNTVQQRSSNLALETQNVAPPAGTLDLAYLSEASLQLSSQLDTRIRVLDPQGTVLVDSRPEGGGEALGADALFLRAMDGGTASRVVRQGGRSELELAVPVEVGGSPVGVVYLSQPLRDMAAVIRDLRTRWLVSTLVALVLSAAAGLVLSGAIARPLRRLTEAAGAVARGRLDPQVPEGSDDEIGRLSRAFNDMTARLRAARQAQVDLVANVSHELRTPLTAVKGMVETLRDGAIDDPAVRDRFLETVEDETDRLIRLVNDLLTLSRVDSEALSLQRGEVDVAALAGEAAARLEARAQARGVSVQVEAAATTPPAWADGDRVLQVLLNLLDNAVKYSQPGGRVVVRLTARGDAAGAEQVQVQVQDEGIGIAAQHLDRIGERFYRADRARSRAEGGSGLGLAIAQALVAAHGGRLWVESCEGEGTAVTFTLPAA